MANGTCGKTIVAGMIDRGSTVMKQKVLIYVHESQQNLSAGTILDVITQN